jgi:hypothetical protein
MKDTTYNGWTNYTTWRVQLEIFDGLEYAEMFNLDLPAGQLGNALKDYAEELIAMSVSDPDAPNLALDYATAFLSDVNWYELANHILADRDDQGESK